MKEREGRFDAMLEVALKLITVMFPFVLGLLGWMVATSYAHESRLDVIEDSRKGWIERYVESHERTERILEKFDGRLHRIEVRLGVNKKEDE